MYFVSLRKSLFKNAGIVFSALLASLALWQHMGLAPTEIGLFIIFAGSVLLFRESRAVTDKNICRAAWAVSVLFALLTIIAKLDIMEGRRSYYIWMLIRFVGLSLAFSGLLKLVFSRLSKVRLTCNEDECQTRRGKAIWVFFGSWLIYVAVFLVWLLNEFPGWLYPDSTVQLMQVTGDAPLSNAHPIIHTMTIKLIYQAGLALFNGNANYAIALYSFVQILFLAMCFAYLISTLYRLCVRKMAIFPVFLSYIVLPFHGTYSIAMLKDIPFGGIVLLLCCSLLRLMRSYRSDLRPGKSDVFTFFISSVCMCLFRSNGLYAYILFVPFAAIFFLRKNRLLAAVPVVALAIALVVKGPFYSSLGIIYPDTIEGLNVPAQHIARAIVDGAELSDEQYELLSQVVDVEQIPLAYSPSISDPIKVLVRYCNNQDFIEQNKAEFFQLWLELGLENPGSYLKAQIGLTRSYWYPTVGQWEKAYFSVPDGSGIELSCKLPQPVSSLLSAWCTLAMYSPFLGILSSIGGNVWLYIALLGLCIARRRYEELTLFLPVLAVWLTLLIATPLDNEFRYAYCVFTTLPLMCVVPFLRGRRQ